MALLAADNSNSNKKYMVRFLINLASSGYDATFRQALALVDNTTNKYDPNWIYLSSIAAPEAGECEKKKDKGKFAYYCDFHKRWSFIKSHSSATYNSKKILMTSTIGNGV